MEKKYQIFISSTYDDLKEVRKKVQDAILTMYHFPVGMELFGAADDEQWEIIKETIDSSDYYLLIIAHRYGSVIQTGPDAGISYTEREFRYARDKKIPILVFIMGDEVQIEPSNIDKERKKIEKLKRFKEEAKNGRTVVWWENADDLATKVTASLHKEFNRKKRPGWIRGDAVDVEKSLQEIIVLNNRIRELEDENKILKAQITERKPELHVGISCEGEWKIVTKHIQRPEYILGEYLPISLSDAVGICSGKVTQAQIDKYNRELPTREEVETYIDKLLIYKHEKETNVNFDFCVENLGNCKANDINISIEFPEQILVLRRDTVKTLEEPKAPKKPVNPIMEVYERSLLGMISVPFDQNNFLDSLDYSHKLTDLLLRQDTYDQIIEDNCIILKIQDLLHTQCINYNEYCIVPLKPGKFQIKCMLMCEEFLQPVEQIIDIEVVLENKRS